MKGERDRRNWSRDRHNHTAGPRHNPVLPTDTRLVLFLYSVIFLYFYILFSSTDQRHCSSLPPALYDRIDERHAPPSPPPGQSQRECESNSRGVCARTRRSCSTLPHVSDSGFFQSPEVGRRKKQKPGEMAGRGEVDETGRNGLGGNGRTDGTVWNRMGQIPGAGPREGAGIT